MSWLKADTHMKPWREHCGLIFDTFMTSLGGTMPVKKLKQHGTGSRDCAEQERQTEQVTKM